jgi:hypothetical protein
MNLNLDRIAQRRSHLQEVAASQRAQLGQCVERLRAPLALVDRGVDAIRFLRRNPLLLGGASALFIALRRYRISKWLQRGWLAWQLVRRLRNR